MSAARSLGSLKAVLLRLLKVREVQFTIGGGMIAVIGAGLLFAGVHWLHLSEKPTFYIQLVITLALNFAWNQFVTWRDVKCSIVGVLHRIWKFVLTRVFSLGLNAVLFVVLTTKFFGFHYMAAYVVCLVVVMAVNYITSHKFVFTGRLVTEKG
jgi:putative flippase GtrA